MTNDDVDFDTWFHVLSTHVLEETGVTFSDEDSVRSDYDAGLDMHEVAASIIAEYGGRD